MGLFNKKNKTNKDEKINDNQKKEAKEILALNDIDLNNKDYVKVEKKYARSLVVDGYPSLVNIGWLDDLYSAEEDLDVALYIKPSDDREAIEELTKDIVDFQTELANEKIKGNMPRVSFLKNKINSLYEQRSMIEQNYESLFYVEIISTLYADSKRELEISNKKLNNKLRGKKIDMAKMYLQQEKTYRSGLPFGKTEISDKFRNLNSGALTSTFPFYNAELSHKNGILIGINLITMTPVMIDFFNNKLLNNFNMSIFGETGSGKTHLISVLTMRSALRNIRSIIIDVEGEFKDLTFSINGHENGYIDIKENSSFRINPFDIEENDFFDNEVDLNKKNTDILTLMFFINKGLTREEKSVVSKLIDDLYRKEFGINEDSKSLYIEKPKVINGELVHDAKKEMPTLSDFYNLLVKASKNNDIVEPLIEKLKLYIEGSKYSLFDSQTSESLREVKDFPIVTLDISSIEDTFFKQFGMLVALIWTWEKIIKKNLELKKRIVCDSLDLHSKNDSNFNENEIFGSFLETLSRRARTHNSGLLVASNSFIDFIENSYGKSIISNSATNIFMRQNLTNVDVIQEYSKLSEGERNFLLSADRGHMLLKMNKESSIVYAFPFDYETNILKNEKGGE